MPLKEAIAESAEDAILGIDLSGKITYCNPAATNLLGCTSRQLLDKRFELFLPQTARLHFEQIREAILFNEHLEPFPAELISRKGSSHSVVVQYSPIKDRYKKINGISAILRKISPFEKAAGKAQALLETAPDAMVIVNQDGQIVLVNAQTETLFGYKKQELLGKEVEILIPDKFLKHHKEHRNRYSQKPKTRGMGQGMELYGKKKDGSNFPVEISLSPLKTDQGLFISAAIRDITDRKKAENKFRGLLESAPDAVVIVGEEGVIQLVNAQVQNIFGYTKDELTGKKVEILIPERYHGAHTGYRGSYFSNPKMRPMGSGMELMGLRKNGEEFPVEISLSPLETEEGILVSAAIRDITERKKSEKELEAFNQQLQTKNKELEQFAYIASHDLQEPLRTVTNFSGLLSEQYAHQLDEPGQKSLRFISEATARMSQLIKGLLDYSRIGRDRQVSSVDCNKLLREIQTDLTGTLTESRSTLKIGKLPVVKGHYTELRLLFQNLLSNATKFHDPETKPKVEISARPVDSTWEFAVKDNGIGIPQEQRDRIFIIFQRLHGQRQYPGSGIGLAHCRKIVELHGGRIWVESTPGVGSTFYFTLPA